MEEPTSHTLEELDHLEEERPLEDDISLEGDISSEEDSLENDHPLVQDLTSEEEPPSDEAPLQQKPKRQRKRQDKPKKEPRQKKIRLPGVSEIEFSIADPEIRQKIEDLQPSFPKYSPNLFTQQINQAHTRSVVSTTFPDYKRKPNMFGFFICLLSDLRFVHNNEDLLERCKKRFVVTLTSEDEDLTELPDGVFQCACSQRVSPENIFTVTSLDTDLAIHVGSTCILKHKLLTEEEIKALYNKRRENAKRKEEKKKRDREELERQQLEESRKRQREEEERIQAVKRAHASVMAEMMRPILEKRRRAQMEEQQRLAEQRKQAQMEKQRRLAEERAAEEARRIEVLKMTYRQCEDCKEYHIEKKSPPKITRCKPCWQIYESKKPKKICACGEEIEYSGNLTCTSCWRIEQSKKPKEPCVDCGVAPRNNGPRCLPCFQALKKIERSFSFPSKKIYKRY